MIANAEAAPIERRACPVCGERGAARRARGVRSCRRCGVLFRQRCRAVTAAEWDDGYFADGTVMAYYLRRRSAFRNIVALVDRVVPRRGDRRWLDVGCGPGALLAEAHAAGFRAVGIEQSARCVREAQALVPQATLLHGPLEEQLPRVGAVAVASLTDVLRLAREPGALLAALRETLAPGGWLVVRETLPRRFRRGDGVDQAAPLQQWTPAALERGLRHVGFVEARSLPSPLFVESDGREAGAAPRPLVGALKAAAWPAARLAHRATGGRVYLLPNFLTLARR